MSKRHTYRNIVDKNRFTINANGDCVAFALGNLQYRASDGKWRFAEHQYDVLRDGGGQTTPLPQRETQTDWIDLFNYGATGYNNGQTAWQPWTINTGRYDFYNGNTAGTSADFSYPYNQQERANYRTLTDAEWAYVALNRVGERFAKAKVNGIEGLILIPDGEASGLTSINVTTSQYTANSITAEIWNANYEPNGYIFLPCGGWRNGTSTGALNTSGYYRASTQNTGSNYWRAYYLQFHNGSSGVTIGNYQKSDGLSVRLVMDI